MSTLKVDTLQPNAQAAVSVNSAAIVTGTSTLQGNVTAQGNLDVSGTLATSGTLTATKVALAGASAGGSGTINGVSTMSCQGVTASGTVSAATMTASGNVSCNSLTIDGAAYEQRVVAHVSLELSFEITDFGSTFNFLDYVSVPTITERRKKGFGSISWQSNGSGVNRLQCTLSPAISQTQYTVVVEILDDLKQPSVYPPNYDWHSNSRLDINGWIPVPGAVASNLPDPKAKYINVTILG